MQQELYAGATLNFLTATPDYLASAGWTLHFRLVPRTAGGTAITIDCVAEGDDHRAQATASATAAWAADNYTWTSYVTKAAEVQVLDQGQITVKPNPLTVAAGYDGRSQAKRTLDDLKTARATFNASQGFTRSYKIADRERVFSNVADILAEITYWEQEVQREETAAAKATGQATGGRFFVRQVR